MMPPPPQRWARATWPCPASSAAMMSSSPPALSGAAASNYVLAGTGSISSAIGTITPASLSVVAQDASRPANAPNPPFLLLANGLRGGDTLASIGVTAGTPAQIDSPPGTFPINVIGAPQNYTLTATPGVLTIVGAPPPPPVVPAFGTGFVEQRIVPILGGLVQMGAATGFNNMVDTLGNGPNIGAPLGQAIVWRNRYGIWTVPSSATSGSTGATGFLR